MFYYCCVYIYWGEYVFRFLMIWFENKVNFEICEGKNLRKYIFKSL